MADGYTNGNLLRPPKRLAESRVLLWDHGLKLLHDVFGRRAHRLDTFVQRPQQVCFGRNGGTHEQEDSRHFTRGSRRCPFGFSFILLQLSKK